MARCRGEFDFSSLVSNRRAMRVTIPSIRLSGSSAILRPRFVLSRSRQ